jgi:erythronate-4-phosphate dehydrogenase
MKVVVDDQIPYIREPLASLGVDAVYINGKAIDRAAVADADALIIRTRTRCDAALLGRSAVRFIATATIGYDHIDTDYCRDAGITWTNCPGCNATSVAQYMESIFFLEAARRACPLHTLSIGIVGVGHVGTSVAQTAAAYGMRVLLNDPPRAATEGNAAYSNLEEIADDADIITLHVPLQTRGEYPTYHLVDTSFYKQLARRPLFVNTSRGEVADTQALLAALNDGSISAAVIDVWEHEPHIDTALLDAAWIATPHIAGYSADGKANATRMALEAFCRYFKSELPDVSFTVSPPPPPAPIINAPTLSEAILRIYDPRRDSQQLKRAPEKFEYLRENYPLRREKTAYRIL